MKIGSVVYACEQGLGRLAKSFYDAGVITDVLIVDRAELKSRPLQPHWFPGADVASSRDGNLHALIAKKGRQLIDRVDAVLFLETPHDWTLFGYAKQRGVPSALEMMYECMPDPLPTKPNLMLCPSLLDLDYYHGGVFLPVPVEVPWRQRTRAEVFIHNAGNGGLLNRNGTGVLLDAMRYVKSPIRLIVRSQKPLQWGVDDPRVEVRIGTVPYEQLWDEGDVLVHPHHFDGLSLPLQEARAAGMLVMGVDRCPDNTWLPREPLIPVSGYTRKRVSGRCNEFDYAILDPRDVAAKIDAVYGMDLGDYSRAGREWAASMSWQSLRPKYLDVLEGLCDGEK